MFICYQLLMLETSVTVTCYRGFCRQVESSTKEFRIGSLVNAISVKILFTCKIEAES